MKEHLPLLSAREVLHKLERYGFVQVHQRGSHGVLKDPCTHRLVVVPVHQGHDLPRGTLYNIVVHQAGLSVEVFNAL